jgi:alpha-beta hydrolase superfamily lysophospholipase
MKNRVLKIVSWSILLLLVFCHLGTASQDQECVVLLHGLARTEKSLLKLEHHLESGGYRVVNIGYPSREKTIQELSVDAIPAAIEECKSYDARKIHFVTHSMGGILVCLDFVSADSRERRWKSLCGKCKVSRHEGFSGSSRSALIYHE